MAVSRSDKKTIIFAGGGTGGHLLPGIAVAEQLVSRSDCSCIFAGSNRPVEEQIIENSGYRHLSLPASSTSDLRRTPFRFLWNNSRAFFQSRRFLKKEKPAVVIGLGGFASVPVVLAASQLKIPIVLLEQNMIPGRANHFLFPHSDLVCVSFSETRFDEKQSQKKSQPSIVFTGNPVREEIVEQVSLAEKITGESGAATILVLGGSQGASAINNAVVSLLNQNFKKIGQRLHVVHQTGVQDFAAIQKAYQLMQEPFPDLKVTIQPFFTDLTEWYQKADLVISRAGATTLAEIACVGCPAVLIPYPHSIGDHQLLNARYYADRGASILVEQAPESDTTARLLQEALMPLLEDIDQRNEMRRIMSQLSHPGAASEVAVHVERLIVR